MTLPWLAEFSPLAVDLILLIGTLSLLVVDLILPAGEKRLLAWGALGVVVAALIGTFALDISGEAWGGVYEGDALALWFKRVFLMTAGLVVLGAQQQVSTAFSRRQGEYYLLLLFSVMGMSLLAGVRDFILLVVCFELMGIPLYVLAAFARRDAKAVEGGMKLFLVGAVSSAVILYGLSLLCGLAGSTEIDSVARYVARHPSLGVGVAITMTIAGMGFKIGVFPFHMWVPDTYEGSTTPFVAFLSVAPKAAGLAALVQVLLAHRGAMLDEVALTLIALAVATLVVGNLLALNQDNVKRLLGYSGVAQMGFLLMALGSGTSFGLGTLLFYLAGYLFTNIGAFLVIHAVAGDDSLSSFDGLVRRSGWLAGGMLIFLLSLAGIPFVVGFWAKLYVFMAAWQAGMAWLVVLGALLSVLALFYYLRLVRAMFMNPPRSELPIAVDWPLRVAIALSMAFVIGMGLVPGPFVDAAMAAARGFL